MNKIKYFCLLAFIVPLLGCNNDNGVIDVASYVDITGKSDCSDKIQELINNNPNRTLYFRDGTYLLDHQILTPGDPTKSVDLQLSNYAILKASDSYQVKRDEIGEYQDEYLYMVSLGGLDKINDVTTPGSVYSFTGGIIDGSGKAAGIEIAGGRETRVQNVSMKGVEVGLRIAHGVNGGGSSDADIRDLSIICNDTKESYGLKLEGSDNTATNIRIGHTTHGVYITGGTNILKNVHPLHNKPCKESYYNDSIGFEIKSFAQLSNCYSDNFRIAYKFHDSGSFLTDCVAWWFEPSLDLKQYSIWKESNEFNAIINNFAIGFKKDGERTIMAGNKEKLGEGSIHNVTAREIDKITDVTDHKPDDGSLLEQYLDKDEKIHDYR
ncbi:MAG: hypothetical protein MJ208_04275 [Bacilli bacterium]|nr:hypothetical protein [Bacilli bacterium]